MLALHCTIISYSVVVMKFSGSYEGGSKDSTILPQICTAERKTPFSVTGQNECVWWNTTIDRAFKDL